MGYSVRREHVIAYSPVLEEIFNNVAKGVATFITPPDEGSLGKWEYKMHLILKSAEVFKDVEGGKYASLRSLVTVGIDTARGAIKVKPKLVDPAVATLVFQAGEFTEKDLIEDLQSNPATRPGETRMYEFFPLPDFDPEALVAVAAKLGWVLGPKFIQDEEGDPITVSAYFEVSPMDVKGRSDEAMRRLGFKKSASS